MDDRFDRDGRDEHPSDYAPPRFQVIPLDCEITAYAPADGNPLF